MQDTKTASNNSTIVKVDEIISTKRLAFKLTFRLAKLLHWLNFINHLLHNCYGYVWDYSQQTMVMLKDTIDER